MTLLPRIEMAPPRCRGEDFNVVIHDQYNALFTGVELSWSVWNNKIDDFDFLLTLW